MDICTFAIWGRSVLSAEFLSQIDSTFIASSCGWVVLLPTGGSRPPTATSVLPSDSSLDRDCWETSMISSSATVVSVGLWSLVPAAWSSFCGSQLFWQPQIHNNYMLDHKSNKHWKTFTDPKGSGSILPTIFTCLRSMISLSLRHIVEEVFSSLMMLSIWSRYWSIRG